MKSQKTTFEAASLGQIPTLKTIGAPSTSFVRPAPLSANEKVTHVNERMYDRAKFHKLASMMDSSNRPEAITAFTLALDELAKDQDARFSAEYSLGNPDAERAHAEMEGLRIELEEAVESAFQHETTIKQLEETIDRLHKSMAEAEQRFQQVEPPKPQPVKPEPAMPFDWGNSSDDLTSDTPQPRPVHSGPFPWKTLWIWAYGIAAAFWLAMVWSPGLQSSFSFLFLPLLWLLVGVPAFIYLRKVRDTDGWSGVAVKVCLTADIFLGLILFWAVYKWAGEPDFTSIERGFVAVVFGGAIWFLYSERFFSWVLDDQKRRRFVIFPGAIVLLLLVIAWVTDSNPKPVNADSHSQSSSHSPRIRKPHAAPKPPPPTDAPPQILNYDFELPSRNILPPALVETSYFPAIDRPRLVASVFQNSASSEDGSGGVLLFLLALVVVVLLKSMGSKETKRQRQAKYQKALNEANAPLPQNETGNAGHASIKDMKKRGWA